MYRKKQGNSIHIHHTHTQLRMVADECVSATFFRFRPSVDIQNSKLLEPVAKLGVISYNTGIRSYGQKVWCQNRGK